MHDFDDFLTDLLYDGPKLEDSGSASSKRSSHVDPAPRMELEPSDHKPSRWPSHVDHAPRATPVLAARSHASVLSSYSSASELTEQHSHALDLSKRSERHDRLALDLFKRYTKRYVTLMA